MPLLRAKELTEILNKAEITHALCDARLEMELKLVECALGKITAGTYGVCEDCNQPIPAERLEARPHAIRCIECERKAEHIGS